MHCTKEVFMQEDKAGELGTGLQVGFLYLKKFLSELLCGFALLDY